jgi:hypothetical protein
MREPFRGRLHNEARPRFIRGAAPIAIRLIGRIYDCVVFNLRRERTRVTIEAGACGPSRRAQLRGQLPTRGLRANTACGFTHARSPKN